MDWRLFIQLLLQSLLIENVLIWKVRVAEWLALQTGKRRDSGSIPATVERFFLNWLSFWIKFCSWFKLNFWKLNFKFVLGVTSLFFHILTFNNEILIFSPRRRWLWPHKELHSPTALYVSFLIDFEAKKRKKKNAKRRFILFCSLSRSADPTTRISIFYTSSGYAAINIQSDGLFNFWINPFDYRLQLKSTPLPE